MTIKRKINYELIASTAAVLMAFLAVLVSLQQTRIAREQQKASMWPHLEIYNSQLDSNQYTFILSNQGVGPAIIKKCEVYLKDTVYRDFGNIMNDYHIDGAYSSVWKGSIIQSGQNTEMLKLMQHKEIVKWFTIRGKHFKGIKVEYASIYGDCWQISYGFKDDNETFNLGQCSQNLGN